MSLCWTELKLLISLTYLQWILYLLFSKTSVMPALSASSSILNFANSWSNFLKCRSTFWKERKKQFKQTPLSDNASMHEGKESYTKATNPHNHHVTMTIQFEATFKLSTNQIVRLRCYINLFISIFNSFLIFLQCIIILWDYICNKGVTVNNIFSLSSNIHFLGVK